MLMTFSLIVEIALTVLLAATLVYCAILERRLSALRKNQDGFKETITELNEAITTAGASMRMLKSSVAGAAETLDDRLKRARGLSDELALLTNSGERIAQRIERGAGAPVSDRPRPAGATPSVLANRLDALRPAMGNVR
jgi:ABC-type transporter Mla subunit MlaD